MGLVGTLGEPFMLQLLNAPRPAGVTEEDGANESLTQIAIRTLRDDIICGKLKPGARLRVAKLRDLYGIGASPLREALSRLVPIGFVVSVERRGFVVAPISLREFRELTDLRKLLEKEAAKMALLEGNDNWEGRLVAALHKATKVRASAGKLSHEMKEWEAVNEDLQEALFSGCSSNWLLSFRSMAYFYAKRYLRVCLSAQAIRELHKDLPAMADAALAQDIDKLQKLIEVQLERIYLKVEASGKVH